MTKKIISQQYERSQKLNDLLQELHKAFKDIYTSDLDKLVYLCYELGATSEDVAGTLGIAGSTVRNRWPVEGGKNGKQ